MVIDDTVTVPIGSPVVPTPAETGKHPDAEPDAEADRRAVLHVGCPFTIDWMITALGSRVF
jgi:hypothetical protein